MSMLIIAPHAVHMRLLVAVCGARNVVPDMLAGNASPEPTAMQVSGQDGHERCGAVHGSVLH